MEENKNVKRRERIKTILIIFLVILLVLTFFSNTILNHSLPTVSAQYAGYGQINEKVRGSGLVTANQNYDVVAEGNRTVASVSVKVGDEIRAGDKLFVLDAANSDEAVQAAEDAIREAELAYQKSLLTAVPDYVKENQDIADARADLQMAISKLNAARSQAGSAVSAFAYQQASSKAAKASERIAELNSYLALAASGETESLPAQYTASQATALATLTQANADLDAAQTALAEKQAAVTVSSAEQQITVTALERAAETADTAAARAKADYDANTGDLELKRQMEDSAAAAKYAHEDVDTAKSVLTDILAKEDAVKTAETAVQTASAAVNAAKAACSDTIGTVKNAINSDLTAAQQELDAANAVISAYEGQDSSMDISSLEDAVTAAERNVQGLLIALTETKKEDDLAAQSAALDLQSQQIAIDKQKEALEKLKKDSGTVTVTSKNAGVVSSVNFAAGDEVMDGSTLATVTLTDSGYTLDFTVSAEQARKVKIGALAEVTNNYYNDITAKLISSKADTSNPSSQDRVLTFDITGKDVTPGQMLALSITCTSQSYDCVVPSSAIMEDKDGKFVLLMQSKATPLGNRYFAARANVNVLASDELNSAVQGDVNYSDFIITTSEKPLKPGDQVRMED